MPISPEKNHKINVNTAIFISLLVGAGLMYDMIYLYNGSDSSENSGASASEVLPAPTLSQTPDGSTCTVISGSAVRNCLPGEY